MTSLFKSNQIPFISMSDFKNGSLNVRKPTMVMVYWNDCPHCHDQAPTFVNHKTKSRFHLTVLDIGDISDADDDQLRRITRWGYDGSVPTYVMFDSNGKYVDNYNHAINGGCLKFEYEKMIRQI